MDRMKKVLFLHYILCKKRGRFSAISNHDESTGGALDPISAVLSLRIKRMSDETEHMLKINVEKKTISINLQIDTNICSMYEYFEIFLGRMMMRRGDREGLLFWCIYIIGKIYSQLPFFRKTSYIYKSR